MGCSNCLPSVLTATRSRRRIVCRTKERPANVAGPNGEPQPETLLKTVLLNTLFTTLVLVADVGGLKLASAFESQTPTSLSLTVF
jgi:hypothetical protein